MLFYVRVLGLHEIPSSPALLLAKNKIINGAHFVTRNSPDWCEGALDRSLYQADLHDTVVEAAKEEKSRDKEGADIDDVEPPLLCHVVQGTH